MYDLDPVYIVKYIFFHFSPEVSSPSKPWPILLVGFTHADSFAWIPLCPLSSWLIAFLGLGLDFFPQEVLANFSSLGTSCVL